MNNNNFYLYKSRSLLDEKSDTYFKQYSTRFGVLCFFRFKTLVYVDIFYIFSVYM